MVYFQNEYVASCIFASFKKSNYFMDTSSNSLINNAFINFCGIFSHQDEKINLRNGFRDWFEELDQKEKNFYKNNYYDNYNNVIVVPQLINKQSKKTNCFRHIVRYDNEKLNLLKVIIESKKIEFKISRIDLFLFTETFQTDSKEKLGILSFRVELCSDNIIATDLSDLIFHLRRLEGGHVELNSKFYQTIDFINDFIIKEALSKVQLKTNFGIKLKSYLVINLNSPEIDEVKVNEILFDLGHLLPLGTTQKRDPNMALATEYYNEIYGKNKISVYRNWMALTLYDTFTVIGNQLNPITWGDTYFNIYVHCLHLKYSLFSLDSELWDDSKLKYNSQKIKLNFLKFLNSHNFNQISYNFLPNLIYEKISNGLNIQQEVESLERKVKEIDLYFDNRRNNRLNNLLMIITLISFISAAWDLSEYSRSLINQTPGEFYPYWGIVCLGFSILMIIVIYLLNKSRRL